MGLRERFNQHKEKEPIKEEPMLQFSRFLTAKLNVKAAYELTDSEESSFAVLLTSHLTNFLLNPQQYEGYIRNGKHSNLIDYKLKDFQRKELAKSYPNRWSPPPDLNFEATNHARAMFNISRSIFRQMLENLADKVPSLPDEPADYVDDLRAKLILYLTDPAPSLPDITVSQTTLTEGINQDLEILKANRNSNSSQQ